MTAAAGTALVGAIATDAWQQVREAVIRLWHRGQPDQTNSICAELDMLREQVLQAHDEGDDATQTALAGTWQIKLQQLLRSDPALTAELKHVLDQVLTPALTRGEPTRVGNIITGTASDFSHLQQAGGDQYTAGRDLTGRP